MAMARPRSVLAGVIVFMTVGVGAYFVAPWVLPLRVLEGPLVQQSSAEGATIVWFTTRPAACEVVLDTGAPQPVRKPAKSDGTRQQARIDGLKPGREYTYELRGEGRVLGKYTLHTNKSPGQPVEFIVFGDSGKALSVQYRLADRMVERRPDFLLHTGDLVYPGGDRIGYADRFFAPYSKLLERVTFWPSLGNHDVSKPHFGAPFCEVFELPENGPAGLTPEHHYWFDYADLRVGVVDSNAPPTELRDKVGPWLVDVMSASGPRWRMLCMHHPPYSIGPQGQRPETAAVRDALVPSIDAAGIDVVFAGHDHFYQRTHPMRGGEVVEPPARGTVYIISGAGGAELYEAVTGDDAAPAWLAAYDDTHHSFTLAGVTGDTLTIEQIGLDGKPLDTWKWERPGSGVPGSRPTTQAP